MKVRHKTPDFQTAIQVADLICEFFGYDIEHLKAYNRQKRLVRCRRMMGHVLRDVVGFSEYEAGIIMNRDHSNVNHHCKTFIGYLENEKATRERYKSLLVFLFGKCPDIREHINEWLFIHQELNRTA